MIPPLPAAAADDDKPGGFENGQVLHHGESREPAKRLAEAAGGAWSVAEQIEYPPPGWVGQCSPDGIRSRRIHMLPYGNIKSGRTARGHRQTSRWAESEGNGNERDNPSFIAGINSPIVSKGLAWPRNSPFRREVITDRVT